MTTKGIPIIPLYLPLAAKFSPMIDIDTEEVLSQQATMQSLPLNVMSVNIDKMGCSLDNNYNNI